MRSRPLPFPRRLLAPVALAAGLLLVPAGAEASQVTSVSIANGDAVVDRTIVAEVQGDASINGQVTVNVNPAGLACAETRSLNANNRVPDAGDVVSVGKGSLNGVRLNVRVGAPGTYTLCAYFDGYPDGSTPPAVLPLSVRNPNASLTMGLLAAPVPDHDVPLALTTFAEVKRELWVDLNAEGVPCGLNTSVNNGTSKVSGLDLLGGPTTTVVNVSMPSTPGRYHLCGYIARAYADATPLLTSDSGSFLVGTPPPPPAPPAPAPKPSCTVGPRAVKARGTIGIRCKNATGAVEIRAKRGGRTVKVTRRLVGGVAKVRVRTLGMRRGVTKVSVFQSGKKLGGRSVRRR